METIAHVAALRAQLWDAGYRPVPVFNADAKVKSPGKQPLGKAWEIDARKDPPFCANSPAVPHALNTGILCDGLRAIDIDIDDAELAVRCRGIVVGRFGEAPIRMRRNSPRCLILYRAAVGEPSTLTLAGASHTKDHACKVEVLGRGKQFVAFGTHHSGADLEWFPDPPGAEQLANLPAVTEDSIAAMLAELAPILGAVIPTRLNGHDHHHLAAEPQADPLRIAAALADIPNDGPPDWEAWNRVCMAVWRATGGAPIGWELLRAWSARNPSYDPTEARGRWDHYATSPPTKIGAGTVFYLAREAKQGGATQQTSAEPTNGPDDDDLWRDSLIRNETKPYTIQRSLANALIALREAPTWRGVFAWNDFASRALIMRHLPGPYRKELAVPREIADADLINITNWIQRAGIVVSSAIVREATLTVCADRRFHPVRDYLAGLTWDGTPRLDQWLTCHLGVTDTQLHRAFAAKWMIGLVARVMTPGCKFDTALILESAQGLGKSTAVSVLSAPWFTDHITDLHSKDSLGQLQGMWIVELAELSSLGKAEIGRIKAFLSTKVDRFRAPYGHFTTDYPRQCGFAGTINPGSNGYLRDETGARRFWTVACAAAWPPRQKINIAALAAARDQLWAEATLRFHDGEPWHLPDSLEDAQAESASERQEDDPREPRIRDFIQARPWVRMDEILGHDCLCIPIERWTKPLRMEIGQVMTGLRWCRRLSRDSSDWRKREWRYYPPKD